MPKGFGYCSTPTFFWLPARPLAVEERLVGLFARSRGSAHALVNAGEPLDDRSGAIVARQRFLASRTNSFGQGQFSDARELALSPFTPP